MSDRQKSCKELVREEYRKEIATIRQLWELYRSDPEASTEDGTNWNEYGLSFDYVPPGTFTDQKRGYWRYQISWGGPSDEFRFYADENCQLTRIEYWYMDWFDGAKVIVNGKDRQLWDEIWSDWIECELPQAKRREAMQE